MKSKLSRPTTKRTEAARATKPKVWRDARGRFATPVVFDGKRYRSKTTGAVARFATTAAKPSKAAKVAKKAGKPVSFKAKPLRGGPKAPPKPSRPVISKPKAPRKAKKPEPKKAKPRKPEAPPIPPKTPLPQLFGKDRKEKLVPFGEEIKARIMEAEALVAQVQERGLKASSISEVGYEYYQLIAAIEKMSPHDIYTLFVSP